MRRSERYLVEAMGEIGGILVSDEKSYRFHASSEWAWPIDGKQFPNVEAAERAATEAKRRAAQAAA